VRAVQDALGGCPRRVGGRRRNGRVVFHPMDAWCVCESCPAHNGAAYEPPFRAMKVVNAARQEEYAREETHKVAVVEYAKSSR
jgi:hypothetical protein